MVALNFNASGVKPNAALEPIPTGQYPVMITNSQSKPTKSGNGSYLELEMTIQGGEFAGRKVFDRLNLQNPNQTAVDIAYATLSAICHVTGRMQVQDSSQLHGVPFIAVVTKKPREDQPGAFSNEVKGYKDINGNDPGMGGQVAQPAAQPQWAQGAPQGAVAAGAPQGQVQTWGAGGVAANGPQAYAPQPAANAPQGGPPSWAGNAPAAAVAPAQTAPQAAQVPAAYSGPPAGPAGAGAAPPWAQQ